MYVNGKCLRKSEEYTVIVYNKPKGELVSKKDDRGRRTIYESLPKRFAHFIPVGRLDFASEGLLLLSDDARVVTKLMESKMERIYLLKLSGKIQEEVFEAMENGLPIIAYDVRVGPEAIVHQGENGYLIKDGDAEDFAAKLDYLIENKSERQQMSECAIKRSNDFMEDVVMKQWIDLLER